MNLINIYIQEVTRRLPEKNREDISLELRSTIEDMLPDDYSEDEVKDALEKLGSPAALASGYRDQPMHLIGLRYFDLYVSLFKMILPIAAVVALISMIAEYFIGFEGEKDVINIVLLMLGEGIWRMIEAGIQVFFWLTLIFAIIERTDKGKDQQPLSASLEKWTPNDLKNLPYIPREKAVSKLEVFGYLMWTAIWATLYFYANHLVGIYEGGGDGLEFVIPAFNQEVLLHYWPVVFVAIALEIGLALYKLLVGQWTKKVAIFNTAAELFATVLFIMIVSTPNLMNQKFMAYMSDLFTVTAQQLEVWINGSVIIIFILSAAINVFGGIRQARFR